MTTAKSLRCPLDYIKVFQGLSFSNLLDPLPFIFLLKFLKITIKSTPCLLQDQFYRTAGLSHFSHPIVICFSVQTQSKQGLYPDRSKRESPLFRFMIDLFFLIRPSILAAGFVDQFCLPLLSAGFVYRFWLSFLSVDFVDRFCLPFLSVGFIFRLSLSGFSLDHFDSLSFSPKLVALLSASGSGCSLPSVVQAHFCLFDIMTGILAVSFDFFLAQIPKNAGRNT